VVPRRRGRLTERRERSAVGCHHGDRARAAEGSARALSVLGSVLIALGVLQVLAGAVLGLWLALIGWFILAAGAERHAAAGGRLREAARSQKCGRSCRRTLRSRHRPVHPMPRLLS
jgi:hypothetical protein